MFEVNHRLNERISFAFRIASAGQGVAGVGDSNDATAKLVVVVKINVASLICVWINLYKSSIIFV